MTCEMDANERSPKKINDIVNVDNALMMYVKIEKREVVNPLIEENSGRLLLRQPRLRFPGREGGQAPVSSGKNLPQPSHRVRRAELGPRNTL